jgi:hypothetical protein
MAGSRSSDCRVWLPLLLGLVLAVVPGATTWGIAGPSARAYVEQAILLANRGECPKAIPVLKRAVDQDARYVRAYTWLGYCYAQTGQRSEAIAAFKRVLALAPHSDDARFARAWIDRLQPAAAVRTAAPTPRHATASPPLGPSPGIVYLVAMPAVVGISEANRPRAVQLFGETYRRALVERRNWWQGRREHEREWRVVYNLQRRFVRFRALAGVEDGSPPEFVAAFEVRGDGVALFEGRPKRAGDVPDNLHLDVTGVLQLELIVRGRDPLHTRDLSVVWADPHVDARPGGPPPSPAPPSGGPAVTPPAAPPGSPPPPAAPPGAPPVTPTPGGAHPGRQRASGLI